MTTSLQSLIETDLIRDEGWKPSPYKDSLGYLTIGVGHNLAASGLCSEAILAQLRYDLAEASKRLDGLLGAWKWHPDNVQRFLLNLSFNLGGKLGQFHHTLSLIQSGNYGEAAKSFRQNRKYFTQVGARAERLARLLELSGEAKAGGDSPISGENPRANESRGEG